jgi:hypothetical protein
MQSNTHTKREYKGKIYVKNIEKIHLGTETGSGSETNWKVGSGSEKYNTVGPQLKEFGWLYKKKQWCRDSVEDPADGKLVKRTDQPSALFAHLNG